MAYNRLLIKFHWLTYYKDKLVDSKPTNSNEIKIRIKLMLLHKALKKRNYLKSETKNHDNYYDLSYFGQQYNLHIRIAAYIWRKFLLNHKESCGEK